MLELMLIIFMYFVCNIAVLASLLDLLREEVKEKKTFVWSVIIILLFGTILAFVAIIYHVFEIITGRSE